MKYLQFFMIFIIPNILGQLTEDEHKINLEDIEDDNLLSEKYSQENEPLITQSTQHLRPPSILAINPYLTHQSPGAVLYATPATENEIHYGQSIHNQKSHYHHPHQIQYLTQHQSPELLAEQNYNQQVFGTPAAVHEHDPSYTYTTIASRQSLLKPIIPTLATYLTPQQQSPEPSQFLYLPHGRNLHHRPQAIQQVVGGIQYVAQQPPSPVIYAHEDQELGNEQKIVADDQIVYHHHHPQPQQIPGSGATYLQYVPYISRGSNNGQYIIMAPIPAGYAQSTAIPKTIVNYSHSGTAQQLVQYVPQGNNQVEGGIQYVTNNEIENVPESVQPHPHPVQIAYDDYTNAYPKHPTKIYGVENSDQSNNNYPNSYSEFENSKSNLDKEDKQSKNHQIPQQESVIPIKQVVSYNPKVQDIQYAKPKSLPVEQNSDSEKSKQHLYSPQNPEKQQPQTSKPAVNNQFLSSNRFSSFQFTTANPTSQRYYAAQKHISSTDKPNQHQQTPSEGPQPWSYKVMPMQYQQYGTRISSPTPISATNSFTIKQGTSTTNPSKVQSKPNSAFRSPIPKYYIATPKTIQSTHRPTTSTFSIATTEQKHQQSQQIHSTASPKTNNNQNILTNSETTFGQRQPKSLLDSYIPSWVVIENQNKQRAQHQNRINNLYNTISYSVPHNQQNSNHLKRSPSPSIPPTKLIRI